MIENRIIKTELIYWKEIKDLQPEKFKNVLNAEDVKESILKYGFAKPFYVWENNGFYFTIDGHTRKSVLNSITDVPEQLPATFIKADNRKEAISILLEVYNQKQNKINQSILDDWLKIEELQINSISLDVNFDFEDVFGENYQESNSTIPSMLIAERKLSLPSVKVVFENMKDLESFEKQIKPIVEKYKNAHYSVSAGEI